MLLPDEAGVFAAAQGAVVAVDDQDRITFANDAARELLRCRDDLVGQPLPTIIPSRLRDRHVAGFTRYVSSGESRLLGRTVRVPALRGDGSEVEVDLTVRVFRRPDGTKLAAATLNPANLRDAPRDLVQIETALARRMYQLI